MEDALQNSAKAITDANKVGQSGNLASSMNSQNTNNNLNNSTASAHLNVYKPTFIINNSY